MCRSLFIIRGHSTREAALTVSNDEQGDLFYSAGPHGKLHRLSVTMSEVTYFILRVHTGTGVSHSLGVRNGKCCYQREGPQPLRRYDLLHLMNPTCAVVMNRRHSGPRGLVGY